MTVSRLARAAFAACLFAPWATGLAAAPATPSTPGAVAAAPVEDNRLRWLDPVIFAPDHAFAAPPPAGSIIEKLEYERLRAVIANATPERRAQAAWDGEHEDPGVFSAAAGRDLAALPATSALLATVSGEVDRMIHAAKAWFKRARPYQVDPTLLHCGKGGGAPTSYPSGHAGYGWSVGWTLARLLPDRAPALLARAQDYALSREICGVHLASDLEASHAATTAAVEHLLSDPRLAAQVAAARAELAAR